MPSDCIGGYDTPVFALAIAIAMIVTYDAAGVRRQAGMHAERINVLFEELLKGHMWNDEELREVSGHTPFEVLGGTLWGLLVTTFTLVAVALATQPPRARPRQRLTSSGTRRVQAQPRYTRPPRITPPAAATATDLTIAVNGMHDGAHGGHAQARRISAADPSRISPIRQVVLCINK